MKKPSKALTKSPTGDLITCPVVEKPFYNKKGVNTEQTEYYLSCSVQDYFIKFCESTISKETFKNHLDQIKDSFKTVSVKVDIIYNGNLDQCTEEEVESRLGTYVVIKEIL